MLVEYMLVYKFPDLIDILYTIRKKIQKADKQTNQNTAFVVVVPEELCTDEIEQIEKLITHMRIQQNRMRVQTPVSIPYNLFFPLNI